ncbi:DUF1972 domain-containing protein [Pediococcus ethanolidurans]|uniref:DUF1972 domain-containing protein n=1 Tax=Pediococcus ethanolidurans TaxID=319653 RepID=UPI001C1E9047|nr:DUF1972 domain-containing protein [Pediococcus ethanolidurans]MBU7564353.1 DUF1972 domain-containing protein [Pediococcus ethanolidurans]
MERHVFIVGSKGIPANYGGYETFVEYLTKYRQNESIHYHVACKTNDKNKKYGHFIHNNADCFNVFVPNIGSAQVQRTAKEFVRCGLVQVVASDAHTLKNRGFAMTKAYQVLNEMDSQYPERFATNARNLLNGEQIAIGRVVVPEKQKRFWLL